MNIINSPIEQITFENKSFLLKRDDLLHNDFSGNKARKFFYFLENDFPNITKLISHGSNQSNAMYSLSVLCKHKGWDFTYYTNHVSTFLSENPEGNYKHSLDNNMDLKIFRDGETIDDIIHNKESELLIKEGGAVEEASYGIEILANEIKKYINDNKIKNLKIFLPSGTGTTALFLQKFLDIEVLTCACVGDSNYLKKQFSELSSDESKHPTIVDTKKKYHFGKLYQENFIRYNKLLADTGIEFDLLYDPIGIETFINYIKEKNDSFLYIHQGGLKGNETMIARYKHKFN